MTAATSIGPFNAAGLATVTTTITNEGGSTATGISLSSLIPANTLADGGSGTFTAAVRDLRPGQSATVTFSLATTPTRPAGEVVAVNASIDYVSDPPGTNLSAESSTGILSGAPS